jgi:HEAT repeat protein
MSEFEPQPPEPFLDLEKLTPEEFAEFYELVASADNDGDFLNSFSYDLAVLTERNVAHAEKLITALTKSVDINNRADSSTYVQHLFKKDSKEAEELMSRLLSDPNQIVRDMAHESLYNLAINEEKSPTMLQMFNLMTVYAQAERAFGLSETE